VTERRGATARDHLHLLACLAAIGAVLAAILVPLGFPPPRVDDAWFKGPAAELAMNGRLASPGITGFFPRVHEIFACYPPLPQLLLALWYRCWGVSLTSSLAYGLAVHTAFAMGLGSTALRLLHGFQVPRRVALAAALVTGAAWLANLALLDRQEELGLGFLWIELALARSKPTARGAAVSGAFAGLAALSSPWTGLLAATVVSLRAAAFTWDAATGAPGARLGTALRGAAPWWAVSGLVAAGLFGGWIAWLEVQYPGVFREQFLGAMQFTTLNEPYPVDLGGLLRAWAESIGYQPFLLPSIFLAVAAFPAVFLTLRVPPTGPAPTEPALARRQASILAAVLYAVGLSTLGLNLYLRPWAYTYCWASMELTAPCLAVALVRYLADAGNRTLGIALALAVAGVAWGDPVRGVTAALSQPAEEAPRAVFAALQAAVPPGEKVAVTSRHWLAFQGRNPWREAIFLTHRDPALLDDCDWLVARAGLGSDLPAYIDAFDLVQQTTTTSDDPVTYAYSLWHRKGR
jgi:hypothetical protein